MLRRFARYALIVTMGIVALMLILFIAYFFRGSLEEFPTEEDTGKVRLVAAVAALLLLGIELGLWSVLRFIRRHQGAAARLVDADVSQSSRVDSH